MMLPDPELDDSAVDKVLKTADAVAILDDTLTEYATVDWHADALKAMFEAIAGRREMKVGKAQAPVRVAVTGRTIGPPLFEEMALMGRDEVLRRLRAGREIAGPA